MSASGRSVSTARAAATITAVVPTLVLMSQVSSWVRSELIVLLLGSILERGWSGSWAAETRSQQHAADGLIGEVFWNRAAQSGHLVAVGHALHLPAVVRQPLSGFRAVGLMVGQRLDIDIQTESLPHPQPALRV